MSQCTCIACITIDHDARRYRRLRVIGVAPSDTPQLENRTCLRFQNLDDYIDRDLATHESRGEYEYRDPSHSRSLAAYVFTWLENRNGGELRDALRNMRVGDRELAIEELEHIILSGGRPPNWKDNK